MKTVPADLLKSIEQATEKPFIEHVCACTKCKAMCEKIACQPKPEEARALITAGYGAKLSLNWRSNSPGIDCEVEILEPAIVGREGEKANFFPEGRCTMLTDEGLCSLHDAGLKPFEGRVALHGQSSANDDSLFPIPKGWRLRDYIATLWDTDEARALVEEWKEVYWK